MSTTKQHRTKRSEEMTKEEYRNFLRYVHSFKSKETAAFTFDISRQTLDGLISRGTGKPQTIAKIRSILNQTAA